MIRVGVVGLIVMASSGVIAQESAPLTPVPATISIEALGREGYEVKAIHSADTRGGGFLVMLQRGVDIRTCLMKIVRSAEGRPSRQSVCF